MAKTRSVSPARKLRSDPGCPRISPEEMPHARPALLTVFSTTQLELPKNGRDFPLSRFWGYLDGLGDVSEPALFSVPVNRFGNTRFEFDFRSIAQFANGFFDG
jgi:hypothetical protein